ncbi:helix-turn-helix protein [Caulifigura coniformis]|uniref:Helix-turn-helix protein n=1 Tax=Caulifigura coniformis TaxID=2527983 RepID=A0A517SEQ3_9PLAN|nr:helix-turn-helix domain-containing protein [Caulifigura coniformis]QDT54601.1 helix-turn-helix protein [Caulifigura coniformis]
MVLQQRFQTNVASLIAGLGWTQAELARQIGVSRSLVHTYMSGDSSPGLEVVQRFADALGVDPARLLSESGVEKSSGDDKVAAMEELLTVTEAAQLAKLSRAEINRKVAVGILPAVRRSSGWWISREAVLKLIDAPRKRGRPRKSQQVS